MKDSRPRSEGRKRRDRLQTRGEETANSISHGLGVVVGLVALPVLIWAAWNHARTLDVLAALVFGLSIILLYGSSMIYHGLPHRWRKAKNAFQTLDHAAIYILIAGSYTPFTLGVLRGAMGWTLFAVVWTLAAIGIIWKSANRTHGEWSSTALYIGMGWLILVAIGPLWEGLGSGALIALAAGGLAYTLGVLFYLANQHRYTHFVWHLFVLAGTTCHVVAILLMYLQ